MTELRNLRECGQVLEGLECVAAVAVIDAAESPENRHELSVVVNGPHGLLPPEVSDALHTWGVSVDLDASASRPRSTSLVVVP